VTFVQPRFEPNRKSLSFTKEEGLQSLSDLDSLKGKGDEAETQLFHSCFRFYRRPE